MGTVPFFLCISKLKTHSEYPSTKKPCQCCISQAARCGQPYTLIMVVMANSARYFVEYAAVGSLMISSTLSPAIFPALQSLCARVSSKNAGTVITASEIGPMFLRVLLHLLQNDGRQRLRPILTPADDPREELFAHIALDEQGRLAGIDGRRPLGQLTHHGSIAVQMNDAGRQRIPFLVGNRGGLAFGVQVGDDRKRGPQINAYHIALRACHR